MRKEELGGNYDVVEDNKVTAETVGGAQLCQGQMHLVHTEHRGKDREREGRMQVFRTNILTMIAVFFSQTNKVINMLESCKTHLLTEVEGRKDRITTLN